MVCSLDKLGGGDKARVAYLLFKQNPDLNRLLSLGLVPGTMIKVIQLAPRLSGMTGFATRRLAVRRNPDHQEVGVGVGVLQLRDVDADRCLVAAHGQADNRTREHDVGVLVLAELHRAELKSLEGAFKVPRIELS